MSGASPYPIEPAATAEIGAAVGDYFQLLKPRVVFLVAFTGAVGLVLAPGSLHPILALASLIAIALGAGGAGAVNMWYDRDIDAVMPRTRHRACAAGRVCPAEALALGSLCCLFAVLLLALASNWLAAGLLAFSCFYYIFIYTIWLKRRSHHNVVIGGLAGSLPPLIGWVAASGALSWTALGLVLVIFLWTPSHSWALALWRAQDYERAAVPMLPVVRGVTSTCRWMTLYAAALLVLAVVLMLHGVGGRFAGFVLVTTSLLSLILCLRLGRRGGQIKDAQRFFSYSILHLMLVFSALLV